MTAAKRRLDILYCSFCGKSQDDVKKLVVGPAVCICDSCVAKSSDFIAKSPEPGPERVSTWTTEKMETPQMLAVLKYQDEAYAELRERVQHKVDILRKRDVSWADIGNALGISRQAAWERFS